MFWILLTLIFIRPFISSLAFPYANLVISALLLISLLIWLLQRKLPLEKMISLRIPLILLLLGLGLSTACSLGKARSYFELYKYVIGLLLFIWGLSLAEERKKQVITGIVWAGTIISILAIYQYFWGFRHILAYVKNNNITNAFMLDYISSKRVFFPFVTPNILGGYLAMTIPLALSQRNKLLFLVPLCAALLLTASLGGFLSLCAGLGVYYWLTAKNRKKTFLILGATCLAFSVAIFGIRLMTHQAHQLPSFSRTMRLNYWLDTLKIIAHAPLVGVGPGNFNLHESRFAHNSYLQIWAELGIITLIGFIWLISTMLRQLTSKTQKPYFDPFTAGLCATISVFLFHNMIDFSFFLPEVVFIWWVILGLSFPSKQNAL